MANSIFGQATYNTHRSIGRAGRVELLAQDVANELNTYKNFGVFASYTDVYADKLVENGDKVDVDPNGSAIDGQTPGTPAVRSIFNKYSAVLTGNSNSSWQDNPMSDIIEELVHKASSWRLGNNVPLLDTPETRKKQRRSSGCTVRELVQASQQGYFGSAPYSYADFMYCKYLNRIPNNYLITLRRFPIPVNDSIMPIGFMADRSEAGAGKAEGIVPIGTMVTWLGAPGNDMNSILKYSYNMAFVEKTARWEDMTHDGGGQDGILNQLDAMVDPTTRKLYMSGEGNAQNAPLNNFMKSFFNAGDPPYQSKEAQWDQTKIYGPIDRVKKNYARSEEGLNTEHRFSLTFEYELKSYNGINPRQAMLDLLASIFSVTYTTGGFWKGGYKGGGMRQNSIFSKMSVFKANGSFTEMVDVFTKDMSNAGKEVANRFGIDTSSPQAVLKSLGKALNDIGGVLIGGLLNKLGRPARYHANSLISENPVGLWHITVGNPHHPIMTMGNMILKNTTIEHSGPLGIDDFPTNLKVTCEFDRGKPRDQYYLEALYMGGNDRIFHSMSGKIGDMYKVAAEYRSNPNKKISQGAARASSGADREISNLATQGNDRGYNNSNSAQDPQAATQEQKELNQALNSVKNISEKVGNVDLMTLYFGKLDNTALLWASKEQDTGAFKNTKVEKDNSNQAQTSEANG